MAKSTIFVAGAADEDQPVPEGVVDRFTIYVRPGSYRVGFAGFLQEHPTLATGTMEFNVKNAEDGLTAWGKAVGGLQAGLALRPKQPIYHYGEVITLNICIRNVSKETVKFEYVRQFLDESTPTVTDADGKKVTQRKVGVEGEHVPVKVSLGPGEVIQLQSRLQGSELKYLLTPSDQGGKPTQAKFPPLFMGTGKVGLQCVPVFGDSSSGHIDLDPTLSKLATGKLEIEIKPATPTQK